MTTWKSLNREKQRQGTVTMMVKIRDDKKNGNEKKKKSKKEYKPT